MYVLNLIKRFFIFIWDFIFFFFGMPYEQQAKKLKFDEDDKAARGPENPKTEATVYRANKVSNDTEAREEPKSDQDNITKIKE